MADESKLWAAFSYLLFILSGILVYVVREKDPYARFHAMQSCLLTVALFVISFALGIVGAILGFIPFVKAFVGLMILMISSAISLLTFILWLFLMYKAYSGEKFMLPILGKQAESLVAGK